jgi:hypothetical protein
MGVPVGERAFDRCFFPVAIYIALVLGAVILDTLLTDSDARVRQPEWLAWLLFACGALLSVHWLWALRGVIRSWHDPTARVLRFASLGLLFLAALIIAGLFYLPFPVY